MVGQRIEEVSLWLSGRDSLSMIPALPPHTYTSMHTRHNSPSRYDDCKKKGWRGDNALEREINWARWGNANQSVSIRIKSTLITIKYRIKYKNYKYGYKIAWKCENLNFGRDNI